MSELGDYYDGLIKKSEGWAPRASWDYKQHTNGWGTRARSPGEVIDQAEAQRRFDEEINKARGLVRGVNSSLDPGTEAALTSLTFNAGGSWMNSGLGQAIRAGDLDRARAIFLQYNKAGGSVLPGLVSRRAGEVGWFGQAPPAANGFAQPMSSPAAASAPPLYQDGPGAGPGVPGAGAPYAEPGTPEPDTRVAAPNTANQSNEVAPGGEPSPLQRLAKLKGDDKEASGANGFKGPPAVNMGAGFAGLGQGIAPAWRPISNG